MNDSIRYNRILVATDFSSSAEAALRQAIWLARLNGAKIVVAHSSPDFKTVVHRASYKARMDLLEGEGKLFEREVRQQSDTKFNMVAILNIVAVCSVLGLGNREGEILKQTVEPMLLYGVIAALMSLAFSGSN